VFSDDSLIYKQFYGGHFVSAENIA